MPKKWADTVAGPAQISHYLRDQARFTLSMRVSTEHPSCYIAEMQVALMGGEEMHETGVVEFAWLVV
jgi:hypothetical protein